MSRVTIQDTGGKIGITVERDPQVDDNLSTNAVPRWNGTNLTGGSIYNLANGNVAIGRTNPTARLHIRQVDNYRDNGLYIQRAGSDYGAVMYMDTNGVARIGTKSDSGTDYDKDHIFLNLTNNDVDLVRFPSGGNVGVGLRDWDHPQGRLDVRSATDYYLLALGVGAAQHTYLRAGNPASGVVIIGDQQTERTVIQPISGKVGIGTYFPAATLDVNGYSIFSGILTINRDNGQLRLAGGAYNGGLWTGGGKLFLANWDTGAGAAVDLANGNVGIGTASPGAKLEVAGQIKITGGAPGEGRVLTSDSAGLGTWRTVTDGRPETDPQVDDNLAHNAVPRWDRNAEPRRLVTGDIFNTPAGNVGIGTTTPSSSAKLDVNGNVGVRGWLYALNQVVIGGQVFPPPYNVMLDVNGSTLFRGALYFTGDYIPVYNQDGGIVMAIHYDGSLCLRKHLWANEVHAVHFVTETSDEQTKFNQKELDYGLAEVMALKPKRYDQAEVEHEEEHGSYIIHPEKVTNDIGLIAQEVQEIIPEAVDIPEDEHHQLWSIAHSKLIPVLIKAIQEQQKQIEELKEKVVRLEQEI